MTNKNNYIFESDSNSSTNNAQITNNRFNIDVSDLKLFDKTKMQNIKNNKFLGSMNDGAFFFDYDQSTLNDLDEQYLSFNLNNTNRINPKIQIHNPDLNILEKQNLSYLYKNKEYKTVRPFEHNEQFRNQSIIIASGENDIKNNIDLGKKSILLGRNELIDIQINPSKVSSVAEPYISLRFEKIDSNFNFNISDNSENKITGENITVENMKFKVTGNANSNIYNPTDLIFGTKPSLFKTTFYIE